MASQYGFVVRTKNEDRWLGYCLQSIRDNFGMDSSVVVVDTESDDETLSIARMFGTGVKSIPKTEYRPGKALNMGFEELDCDFVCCISAHCEVLKVSKTLEDYLKQSRCFGVMGKQVPVYRGKKIAPKNVWENFSKSQSAINITEEEDSSDLFFHNAFSFIPMPIWQEYNFCEAVSGKEDRKWAKELRDAGYYSTFDPDTVCVHHWTAGCATWKGMG